VDNYFLVLMTAHHMCIGGHTLREPRLVDELHKAILGLYDEGKILNLHSCLKETIVSAITRLVVLGLLDTRPYTN